MFMLSNSRPERTLPSLQPLAPLPPTGFVGWEVLRQYVPVSRATWWRGVKDGRYPKPLKLSANRTVWSCEAIHAFFASLQQQ